LGVNFKHPAFIRGRDILFNDFFLSCLFLKSFLTTYVIKKLNDSFAELNANNFAVNKQTSEYQTTLLKAKELNNINMISDSEHILQEDLVRNITKAIFGDSVSDLP
jgi:hypothetical protein